jgi:hypothetical protein
LELENITLSEVSQVQKAKSCFLSYVEYRPNANTNSTVHTYKYVQSMYPKVGLLEETKRGKKEGKKDSKNKETHHICLV